MKWVNHQIITGTTVLICTSNIFAALFAWQGAIFPDFIEGRPPHPHSPAYYRWQKRHRQLSHWTILYLACLFVVLLIWDNKVGQISLLLSENPLINFDLSRTFLFGMFFFLCGVVFHIVQDSITGTVPFLDFRKRGCGAKIIKVGSLPEYSISAVLIFVLIYTAQSEPEKYLVSFSEVFSVIGM